MNKEEFEAMNEEARRTTQMLGGMIIATAIVLAAIVYAFFKLRSGV